VSFAGPQKSAVYSLQSLPLPASPFRSQVSSLSPSPLLSPHPHLPHHHRIHLMHIIPLLRIPPRLPPHDRDLLRMLNKEAHRLRIPRRHQNPIHPEGKGRGSRVEGRAQTSRQADRAQASRRRVFACVPRRNSSVFALPSLVFSLIVKVCSLQSSVCPPSRRTVSLHPGASVVIIGRPIAIDSSTVRGVPSR